MDELVTFLRQTLLSDAGVIAAFASVSATPVVSVASGEEAAVFPCIIIDFSLGAAVATGDGFNAWENGSVKTLCIAKKSDACLNPYTTAIVIDRAINECLSGNPALGRRGIQGARLTSLRIAGWRAAASTGSTADPQPLIRKCYRSYTVMLGRIL